MKTNHESEGKDIGRAIDRPCSIRFWTAPHHVTHLTADDIAFWRENSGRFDVTKLHLAEGEAMFCFYSLNKNVVWFDI